MNLTDIPLWATLLLTLGLIVRVTRLVVEDSITQGLRNRLHLFAIEGCDYDVKKQAYVGGTRKQKIAKWFSELVNCPWCSGIWVSAAATASAWAWHDTTLWTLTALAASLAYVGAWILAHEDGLHE